MSGDYSFLKRREAPTSLDRDNLDSVFDQKNDDPSDIASKEEIENRKVLRIRRPGTDNGEVEKPVQNDNFKLFSNGNDAKTTASSTQQTPQVSFFTSKPAETAQNSFFGNKASSDANGQNKEAASASHAAGGLFFNRGVDASTTDTKPAQEFKVNVSTTDAKTLFANNSTQKAEAPVEKQPEAPKASEKQEEQPKSSIFGNLPAPTSNSFFGTAAAPSNGSLFGNLNTSASTDQKKTNFFGDLGENKGDKKEGGLFGTSSGSEKTKSGLFDGLLNPSVSNNTGCGSNLFGSGTTPLTGMFANTGANEEDDEEAVNEDEDEVPGQDDVTDPTKTTGTYKYESVSTEVFSAPVSIFKVNTAPGMGAGSMSIEKLKEDLIALIFRNGAKVILHTSYIAPKLTKTGFMNGKTDAMWIETVTYNEENKPTKAVCKMQFADTKTAQEFEKAVKKFTN